MMCPPLKSISDMPEYIFRSIIKRKKTFRIPIVCESKVLVPFWGTYKFFFSQRVNGVYVKCHIRKVDADEFLQCILVVIGAYGEVERFILPRLGIHDR